MNATWQFLRETWELGYWAFFRPSLLQQRMNLWIPKVDVNGVNRDTECDEALIFPSDSRLLSQYLLLNLFLLVPLIYFVSSSGKSLDWFFVLLSFFLSYLISIFVFSLGLSMPIVITTLYLFKTTETLDVETVSFSGSDYIILFFLPSIIVFFLIGLLQLFPSYIRLIRINKEKRWFYINKLFVIMLGLAGCLVFVYLSVQGYQNIFNVLND